MNLPDTYNTVYCIGRNYAAHIAELGNAVPEEPLIFLKPNSSIVRSGHTLSLPAFSNSIHYEAELLVLIGADADSLNPSEALNIVAGYGVGLDLTARDVQSAAKAKGLPWTKAKGFKGAACISDFIAAAEIADINDTRFSLQINGETKQQGHTALMLYRVSELLCVLAQTYGLRRGDIVFTGTPEGVGELHSGDKLELDLAGKVQAQFHIA